jgi:hypothetical protein
MYVADEFLPAQDAKALQAPTESSAAQITLAWDPSTGEVAGYRVFLRIHGTNDWVLLAQVPADPNPRYTVAHSALRNGEFDFGIVAGYDSGQSPLHTSPDPSASPTKGWYLKWQR